MEQTHYYNGGKEKYKQYLRYCITFHRVMSSDKDGKRGQRYALREHPPSPLAVLDPESIVSTIKVVYTENSSSENKLSHYQDVNNKGRANAPDPCRKTHPIPGSKK